LDENDPGRLMRRLEFIPLKNTMLDFVLTPRYFWNNLRKMNRQLKPYKEDIKNRIDMPDFCFFDFFG
jgi:hypothetical protein